MMKSILVLLPFAITVTATFIKTGTCRNPEVRVEWHNLNRDERLSFHKAIKCLQTKPDKDFAGLSQYYSFAWIYGVKYKQDCCILAVASLFLFFHSQRMKDCGYTGPTPYWDWAKDKHDMAHSKIFDSDTGFGGNGKGKGSCVQVGPYGVRSKFQLTWPWKQCLQRDFQGMTSKPKRAFWRTKPKDPIDELNANRKFMKFAPALEEKFHQPMLNMISPLMASSFAPLEPLFFLHLNNIDRLWALWQEKDEKRLREYQSIAPIEHQGRPVSTALAALGDLITLPLANFPNLTVKNVMDTKGSKLCYRYE